METIFSKPMDIQTFDGHHLIGVTKTVVNLEFDTITFYMGEQRSLSQKNNSYKMINKKGAN
jgi:hypothetical protein